jgi:UDP-2-acetamido-2,6-beta-L-arabino-hexul-4-ose reductase
MHSVEDERGTLTEVFKFPHDGQVFCIKMPKGAIRGDHYHKRKTEHFYIVEGSTAIRMRPVGGAELTVYVLSEVVTVPPNTVHHIQALSNCTVLVWADEQFNKDDPDTFPEVV